jgi:hypothetical protein
MQSDTYINDTDSDDEEYSSDSSGELTKNNNVGVFFQHSAKHLDERFMDQSLVSDYDKVRRNLFSRQIMKGILYIDSSIYRVSTTFKSSNYDASFSPVKSLIGFRLLSANLRVPQYNVNNTNNKIWFKDGSDTEYSVTINPGYYSVTELAAAFQEVTNTKAHRVDTASLTVTYYNSSHASMTASKNGMIFKLVHSSTIKFLWNKNNVTKGAARLLGFYPIESSSLSTTHHSDTPPDFSQHYVDLHIPEIPSIACKLNLHDRSLIDRIPLTYSTGSYQRYEPDSWLSSNYFTPIKLDKINIQLWSDNNEEFDSQNTDNIFEFEFTVLAA